MLGYLRILNLGNHLSNNKHQFIFYGDHRSLYMYMYLLNQGLTTHLCIGLFQSCIPYINMNLAVKRKDKYSSTCTCQSSQRNGNIIQPRHEKTNILVSNLSDTNQAVQLQKMARGLKLRIYKVEGLIFLSM